MDAANLFQTGQAVEVAPSSAMSFEDYWKANNSYGTISNSENMWNKFLNSFTGETSRVKSDYQTYLNNLENKNEYNAVQSARAWDKYLSDTQYQRAVEDLKKAGLNPWLAAQGSISGSSVPSSSKASYKKYGAPSSEKNNHIGKDVALLLLGLARLMAL